ncbi:MAG: tetratricopeptide repeat protein, partial [Coriobacteriales bacterium]|nr:tetratricopeptide repeat protein [Coriobacteriales bacterium]
MAPIIGAGVIACALLVPVSFGAQRAVHALRSRRADAALVRARSDFAKGRFASASDNAQASSAWSGTADAQLLLGRSLEAQGDLSAAKAAYESAVAKEPTLAEAQVRLAVVRSALGEPARARRDLIHLLRRDPDNVTARIALADLQAEAGLRRDAIKSYQAVLARDP